jgi:hypothetical protein
MHVFELTGYWSPSSVVAKIQRGDYDLVVLTNGHIIRSYRGISFFGKSIVDSLRANYEAFCAAGDTLVLKPRLRDIAATPEMLSPILGLCISTPNRVNHAPDISIDASAR